jgi:hypothetical protein
MYVQALLGGGWRTSSACRRTISTRSSALQLFAGLLTVGDLGSNISAGGRGGIDSLDGGCACGQLRYTLASKPMIVHCCHCRDCQRQTGSDVLNALIETDRVELLSGEAQAIEVPMRVGQI